MADVTVRPRAGEVRAAASADPALRAGPYAELVTQDAHGALFEAARNGRVYHVSIGLAIALNVASPLGAAGTAPFALFNPTTDKAAVILRGTVEQLVGATPVLNFPVWNYIPNPSGITAAGNVTPVGGRLDNNASSMRCYSSAALTGSLAATLLRPWQGVPTSVSGTVTSGDIYGQTEQTDGAIIVTPGATLAVVFNVAGTNVTGAIALVYEEIDWPL